VNLDRESLDFDIVLIGAGPANLALALHLQRLIESHNSNEKTTLEPAIAILEKGGYCGAHLLSGAILDPAILETFMPDFRQRGCPIEAVIEKESVWFLTPRKKFTIPYLPEPFKNKGNLLISLSRFGGWLRDEAEAAGITVLDNTAAAKPVIEHGRLTAIITDDKAVNREGRPKPGFEPGIRLNARAFVIGEGARGSIFKSLDSTFGLQPAETVQTYETGVKEVWRIPAGRINPGTIHHTFGYPLQPSVYGGGWIYALSDTELSLGFVSAAEPGNPNVDPHLNLQRFKEHPLLRSLIEGGTVLEYGAKAITSGGYHAMPELSGPGFLLTGESAGMLNMQRLKGIHLAIESGVMAAETLFQSLVDNDFSNRALSKYRDRFEGSSARKELFKARHYRNAFNQGLYSGLMNAGIQLKLPGLNLAAATTANEKHLVPGRKEYSAFLNSKAAFKPDQSITFSKSSDLFSSGTRHEEDQPCHLIIAKEKIDEICSKRCATEFGNPCQHFCPAGVYEIDLHAIPILKLNPSNCLHCKTCDIADPYGIITWTPPEGGGGPAYTLS